MDDTESPSSGPAPVDVPVYVRSRGESLGAVVTVPDDPLPSVGVVLMSGLARDRAHRNGLWVKAAQRLARDGMYVLRIDYPGVGNSSGPPQTFDSANAPTWAIEDACRFLVEETPVRRVLLAGSCFGARVVLAAASGIPEVAGVALVAAPVSSRRPVSTKKQIRVRTVKLLNRGKRSEKALRRKVSARAPERPVDPAFADALDRFLERGRVYFLYGDRDIVWGELRVALERLRPPSDRYEVELVPGAIHSFRSLTMQGLALEKLVAWCGRSALDVRA